MRNLSSVFLQSCSDHLLIWVTVFYIMGGCTAQILRPGIEPAQLPLIGAILLLFFVVVCSFLAQHSLPILCPVLLFFTGLLHTLMAFHQPIAPHHIANLVHGKTKVTLVGTIGSYPEFDGQRCRFILDASGLLFRESEAPKIFGKVHGKVLLSVSGKLPEEYRPGMTVMAMVNLDRVRSLQSPGGFDHKLYLAGQSIHCSGWTHATQNLHLIGKQDWPASLQYLPEKIRHHIGIFLENYVDGVAADIYKALLIGSKASLPPEVEERFKACGLMHLLAISGLHLSLLALLSTLVMSSLLRRSHWLLLNTHVPHLTLIATIPLLFGYACIAGLQPPVLRALLMAFFTLFAVLLRKQYSLYPIISAAALVLLASNPLLLFTASFQLSFSAVLAIAVICQRIPNIFDDRTGDSIAYKWGLRFLAVFLVSLAATLGTLPFMLYHFNRFSLVGPIMNLVIEPLLCLWSLPIGLAAIPCMLFSPDLAASLLGIGGWGIRLACSITEITAALPGITIRTVTPYPVEIIAFVLLLGFTLYGRADLGKRVMLGCIGGVMLTLSFTSGLWLPPNEQPTSTTFLDVGQGACTLIELPDGKKMLVDGGGHSSENFDVGERVIAPFLWKKRIWKLDDLVISHPHSDHYNGLFFIHRHFQPDRVVTNGQLNTEAAYTTLLKQVEESDTKLVVAQKGEPLMTGKNYTITCLGIPGLEEHSSSLDSNDQSVVLLLEYMNQRVLLPGDIEKKAEEFLLNSRVPLEADVLIAPHHGSKTSSSDDFINAVAPEIIVVSSGISAAGKLPSPQHIQNWRKRSIPALITAKHGTINCIISEKGFRLKPYAGEDFIRQADDAQTF